MSWHQLNQIETAPDDEVLGFLAGLVVDMPPAWLVEDAPNGIRWTSEQLGQWLTCVHFPLVAYAFRRAQDNQIEALELTVVSVELLPEQVRFDPGEAHRINRVRLALLLHKLPHEIDAMPLGDYIDLVAVLNGDEKARTVKKG